MVPSHQSREGKLGQYPAVSFAMLCLSPTILSRCFAIMSAVLSLTVPSKRWENRTQFRTSHLCKQSSFGRASLQKPRDAIDSLRVGSIRGDNASVASDGWPVESARLPSDLGMHGDGFRARHRAVLVDLRPEALCQRRRLGLMASDEPHGPSRLRTA